MSTLTDFTQFVHEHGGTLFPPASDKALNFVNHILKSHGFSALPKEYEEFLKVTDGIIWDGIELSGTRSEERKKNNYNFPGLIEINLDFMSIDALRGTLVLGRASEELFAYDTLRGKFILIDRLDLTAHSEYPDFVSILKEWIV